MADVYLLDSVKVATPTTGTGSVTVGAAEPGYLTPAEAGAVNGRVYTWRLDDGDDFEIFVGTYSSTGPTVSRDTVLYSKISGVAGTSKINLSGSATLSAVPVADYVVTPRQIREILTADRTYYVRTDGSDSNDGLTDSPGGAFLTLQKALDVVATLDFNGNTVTIQMGNGTYTGGGRVPVCVGQKTADNLIIQGDTADPTGVTISVTGGDAINVADNAMVTVKSVTLTTTTLGHCLQANGPGAVVQYHDLVFGACAQAHIFAQGGSKIVCNTSYTITGGAAYHWWARDGGTIDCDFATVTLTGTPAFSVAFALVQQAGVIRCGVMTFVGSATGRRYSAALNGVINTVGGGATYLPGNVAGETAAGGQYA